MKVTIGCLAVASALICLVLLAGQSRDEVTAAWQVHDDARPEEELASAWNATNDTLRGLLRPGYIIENADLCPDGGADTLQLLVMVYSAPAHFAHRMAIRYTWGHFAARSDVTIGFFLGAVNDTALQAAIRNESLLYRDIVQSRNADSYKEQAVKSASMLGWIQRNCDGAPFVLKVDDDMFLNVPELLDFQRRQAGASGTIFGYKAVGWEPGRIKKSKYYISEELFNGTILPDFLTGPAYLMTRDVVRPLYLASLDRRLFPLEDVLFTGIIAGDLGIKKVHSSKFHDYGNQKDRCKRQRSITTHGVHYKEQFALWSQLLDGELKC